MSVTELAVYAIYGFAIVFPLLPGLVELRRGSDDDALRIDASYARDPRFLGKSMRNKVVPIMREASGEARVQFLNRKNEFAQIVDRMETGEHSHVEDIVLSRGPLTVGAHSNLLDVFARGEVRIGSQTRLRTLAADHGAVFGSDVHLLRWIDIEGDCSIGPGSELGQSASASGRLNLAEDVSFSRLFGRPVVVGNDARAELRALSSGPVSEHAMVNDRLMVRDLIVDPQSTYDVDVVAAGTVEIGEDASVTGSVKARSDVVVRSGARVLGNVVARGNVTIESDGSIFGHIFAEGDVVLHEGALVGERHAPKTVRSSRTIRIARGGCIFGWVIAERGGKTIWGRSEMESA